MSEFESWVERDVGTRVHRVIAGLARAHPTDRPSPAVVLSACCADLDRDRVDERVRRRAVSQGLRTATNVYVGLAWPPDGWVFAGAEVSLGGARADLVWEHTDGRVLIDELKTGADDTAARQVARLLAAGRRRYGTALVGVRLVPLGAINRMRLVGADTGTPPGLVGVA